MSTPPIVYLCSHYPAMSHTFIEREIASLRELGMTVHTASVRPWNPDDLRTESMRQEAAGTKVILDGRKRPWLTAHAALAVRRPRVWLGALARALRNGDRTARARLWQVFYFGEAVVLHHWMRTRSLRHVHVHHANVAADVARLVETIGNMIDGDDSWSWSMTIHGSAEFELSQQWDVAAKVRSARAVACITDFCRGQVMRLVEPAHWDKMSVVHMSVDDALFAPPSTPRSHDGPTRLVTVGRLVHLKGYALLVAALDELARRGHRFDLRIIGSGPEHDELASLIGAAGLTESIELVGGVGQEDLVQHYHWADGYVLTSFLEGLPVVLMEALSTELPVITTQIAGIPELVVDGEMGWLVPTGRIDRLIDALIALDGDPERRIAMGQAGRRAIQEAFTPRTAGPQKLRFFQEQFSHADEMAPLEGSQDR